VMNEFRVVRYARIDDDERNVRSEVSLTTNHSRTFAHYISYAYR